MPEPIGIVALGPLLLQLVVGLGLLLVGEDVRDPQLVDDEQQDDQAGRDERLPSAAQAESHPVGGRRVRVVAVMAGPRARRWPGGWILNTHCRPPVSSSTR